MLHTEDVEPFCLNSCKHLSFTNFHLNSEKKKLTRPHMEFFSNICLIKDTELVLSGQQDYVTKIGTQFSVKDSTKHGLNISTYDANGNPVGGAIDFNGHKLSNAELIDTTIKLPSPNQIIVQTVTNLGSKVEYPVKFPKYESTLATTDDLGVTEEKIAKLETSLSEANQKITALESALGGLKLVQLTQSEYDALTTKDANTLYFIKEEPTTTTTTE